MQFHPAFGRAHVGGDDDIEGAGVELVVQPVAWSGFEKETAAGEFGAHCGQEPRRHLGLEILDHAEAQAGQPGQVGAAEGGARRRHLVQDRPGMAAKDLAGRGQRHRPRRAVEKLCPQCLFQRRYLLADGRGGNPEPTRGGGDGAGLFGGEECLDRPERQAALMVGHAVSFRHARLSPRQSPHGPGGRALRVSRASPEGRPAACGLPPDPRHRAPCRHRPLWTAPRRPRDPRPWPRQARRCPSPP